jgi:transcription elongation factor Elf1
MLCPICNTETGKVAVLDPADNRWHLYCQHCQAHHDWSADPNPVNTNITLAPDDQPPDTPAHPHSPPEYLTCPACGITLVCTPMTA